MAVLRWLPLLVILAAIVAAFAFGVPQALSWSALGARQAALMQETRAHPVASLLLYAAVYALAVALSVPVSVVLSVAGGLLFGTVLGGAAAVAGATIGAVLLFLVVRLALGPLLARRAPRLLARIGPGLERDGFSYLLALRLIPAFPFWLVNLAPALVGMRLLPYAAATALGVIPATVVFVSLGAGLGSVLAAGERPDLGVIFSPRVLGPLIGLAALSLLPVLWRRWRGRAHA
jgi:uncharacterized membrane protein YdjX (TVP38/TMEM64 family)